MNVGELKELLEQVEDDELPVFIGHQPSWPICLSVAGVRHPDEEREICCPIHEGYLIHHQFRNEDGEYESCDELPEDEEETDENRKAVWIVGGDHPYGRSPYAPAWLWED